MHAHVIKLKKGTRVISISHLSKMHFNSSKLPPNTCIYKKGAFCKVGVLSSYCVPFLSYQARKAMDEFYHNMQRACVVHSLEHWEKLYADTIRPKKLLENFRIVYRAYSPHKEEEAFVVCPWMPSPCVYNRRRILPMNHQTIWSPRRCGSPSLGRNTHTPEAEVRSASSMY